jgi:hypothetical protein
MPAVSNLAAGPKGAALPDALGELVSDTNSARAAGTAEVSPEALARKPV